MKYIFEHEYIHNCGDCPFLEGEYGYCLADQGSVLRYDDRRGATDRPEWCPLIEMEGEE
jgi:hypothetical protein